MEADLSRYHHIDLLDFYRGRISSRSLWVRINHLPPDCALAKALNHGNRPWTTTEHLLADLWVLTLQANSEDPSDAPNDHPAREELRAPERKAHTRKLHNKFQRRTQELAARRRRSS